MSIKTFKYRIYADVFTTEKLQWTLDRCRELYNACVQQRRDTWEVVKRHPNYYDQESRKLLAREHQVNKFSQSREFTELKRDTRPEYQDIGDHVSRDVLNRVDKAFDAFFRRIKAGQTPGYPRFQGRSRYDSFTFPDHSNWKLSGSSLLLSKVGTIKVKLHRPINGMIKTCTIKREGEHWYVCFACEVERDLQYHPNEDATGVDLGVRYFATLSDGSRIENPRYYRRAEKKLKKLQEALSRKKRGSTRRKKAVQRVAKAHRKVRNQRQDFLHKESRKLVDRYETVVFEDLSTQKMMRRPDARQDPETGQFLPNGASAQSGLNTSIGDAGWAMFVQMCAYKAEEAGTSLLKVAPHYSTQDCSACGNHGEEKDLSERTHSCPACGVVLAREHNSACNILQRGLQMRGMKH